MGEFVTALRRDEEADREGFAVTQTDEISFEV